MIPLLVSPVNPALSFHVTFHIFGHPYMFLVDTGAAATLLSTAVWKKCLQSCGPQQPSLDSVSTRLLSVDGSPLTVTGTATVSLTINQYSFPTSVIIVDDLAEDAILGLSFLETYKCIIDVPRGRLDLRLGNTPVTVYARPSQHNDVTLRATLAATVVVPPYSEMETLSAVDNFTDKTGTWLLEDTLSSRKRTNVTVARAIIAPHPEIVVRLLNLTNAPVTIRKGTVVATITELPPDNFMTAAQVTNTARAPSTPKRDLMWDIASSATSLSTSEREQFYSLLLSFSDIFPESDDDFGHTPLLQHRIDTGSATPTHQPPRRIPPHQRQEAQHLIQRMLEKNVISRSHSPWSSPVILVRKKDGSLRFCVDYRKINEVTRKDAYPLPRIDDTLDTLAGSSWFTTLDLLSGYWQVDIAESDRDKTAFATREGLFHFNVMPFGLCNAPATFQRLMDMVLAGLLWDVCLVYLDDVIIMGRDFQSHLNNIGMVLERLREAGLKVKPAKCVFFKKEVSFLGHVVSNKGISTDPSKAGKIAHWPTPSTLSQLQQFLGLASYYRRFIRNFATISRPLHRLTEKNTPFNWTTECDNAFIYLKKLLTTAPILSFPDFSRSFILDTDASNDGIGAVLSQRHNDGREYVIAYASRSLSKSERNYSVTRRELLAIVTFTNHFRQYLLGQKFILRTDHHSLTWLTNFKNPEGQLARWLEKLSEYSFHIEHRPGLKHGNADSLSRYPVDNGAIAAALPVSPFTLFSYSPEDIQAFQLKDDTIAKVMQAKEQDVRPPDDSTKCYSTHTRKLFQLWDQLEIRQGILFRIFHSPDDGSTTRQLVVPLSLQSEILELIHAGPGGGHLGQEKTLQKLKDRFYWPGHYNDVMTWCATCPSCTTRKSPIPKPSAPLKPISVGNPMQLVAVDLLGPLPLSQTGNSYILVAADYFTKWCEAYPLPNMEAVTIADKLVNEMFFRFSPPESLHSDQGRQFDGCLLKEICRILQIKKTRTSPYHPQCDGLVERFNRTLLTMLATSAKDNPLNWEQYVRSVCFAYNTSTHSSTGFTPFFLMYGREARLPVDLNFGVNSPVTEDLSTLTYSRRMQYVLHYSYHKVRETLGDVQQRQKALYDRYIHGEPFQEGDMVWLYSTVVPTQSHRKLHHPWTGPYKIIAKLSDINYKIAPTHNSSSTSIVHFNRLKRYVPGTRLPTQSSLTPPSIHSQPLPSSGYNVGDNARLLDFSDDSDADDDDTPVHRYPTRTRHPPDRGPYISH